MLIIADEAPGITPEFWPAVEGILAGGDTRLLLLGNPTVSSGYFYDAFTRNAAAWTRFSISAFDTPNLVGLTLERLLELPDAALDTDPCPYLVTRRWVRERYAEWYNGSLESSPLWQSRVLGDFPSSSSNALIPLAWLEAARRPEGDPGGEVMVGIDPAGPGRDKTAAIAVSGAAIVDSVTFTDSDARGPVLAWLKRHSGRIRLVRVDSAGLGFYFAEHIRDAGYRTIGINVAGKPDDPEKFANAKAERYWRLRERFQAGEVSGLTDDMLGELAAITWLVDPRGRIAIEGKVDVKAALGHSPDLAEALMIAIGEGAPVPYEYRAAPPPVNSMGYGHARQNRPGQSGCHLHLRASDCGNCRTAAEDAAPNVRLAGSLRGRGSW
jgi:hypothetical protein